MTTTIEDNELTSELQELYLITKQWSADLQFISDESDILKNISQKPLEPDFNKKHAISPLELQVSKLKIEVAHLLKRLAPLTYGPVKEIKFSLIEEHQLLKREVEGVLQAFHDSRNELLSAKVQV